MLQQPRPFFMIFFVELWERFGYYGVQGVLAVFFVKQLGFSQEQAFVTFGAFLLRWSMASFPLAAMSATTCWYETHHCSWCTCAGDWLLHDRHVAT
ncbi:hypothetical protein ACLB1O_25800 [Escherichia coli]